MITPTFAWESISVACGKPLYGDICNRVWVRNKMLRTHYTHVYMWEMNVGLWYRVGLVCVCVGNGLYGEYGILYIHTHRLGWFVYAQEIGYDITTMLHECILYVRNWFIDWVLCMWNGLRVRNWGSMIWGNLFFWLRWGFCIYDISKMLKLGTHRMCIRPPPSRVPLPQAEGNP